MKSLMIAVFGYVLSSMPLKGFLKIIKFWWLTFMVHPVYMTD